MKKERTEIMCQLGDPKPLVTSQFAKKVRIQIVLHHEEHFGQQQIEMMLLLYKAVFLPKMIYNCESWSKMTGKDIAELQRGQLHY